MINRTALLLIFCIGAICLLPLQASALPMVGFPIKPSPASGPYQDTEFLDLANTSIYKLSNSTLPTGTTLSDLQSTQWKLSKMNISPSLYKNATDINAFIYFTVKAGKEYDDMASLGGSYFSPVTIDNSITGDVTEYYNAAKTMWDRIKSRYPGATLYAMPVATEGSEDLGSWDQYTQSYTNKGAHDGLW